MSDTELPGTAPTSKRFPTVNQAKHCYMYYNSWHQCKFDYSDEEPQCAKLKGWAMSMCPVEWVSTDNPPPLSHTDHEVLPPALVPCTLVLFLPHYSPALVDEQLPRTAVEPPSPPPLFAPMPSFLIPGVVGDRLRNGRRSVPTVATPALSRERSQLTKRSGDRRARGGC